MNGKDDEKLNKSQRKETEKKKIYTAFFFFFFARHKAYILWNQEFRLPKYKFNTLFANTVKSRLCR